MTPQFVTCGSGGRNLKAFAAKSGRCLVLPSSVGALVFALLRTRGVSGLLRVLAGDDGGYALDAFAQRNLLRRAIRWPQVYRWAAVALVYRVFQLVHLRLMAAAFEDALDVRPDAIVLVHNGFLAPHSVLDAVATRRERKRVYLEGGFFPDTFQCDRQGINYGSSLPRDPDYYRAVELAPDERILPSRLVARPSKLRASGPAELPERYVFVPFQVPSDSQILALSPWIRDMVHLYEVLVRLADAFPEEHFVIKEHPSFPLSIRKRVRPHPRVTFANHEETRQLIERAHAVVTVNSTVGLEALVLGKKVITLGQAHYGLPGLVLPAGDEAALAEAFRALPTWNFDPVLRERFLAYVHNVFLVRGRLGDATPEIVDAVVARASGTDRHAVSLARHHRRAA